MEFATGTFSTYMVTDTNIILVCFEDLRLKSGVIVPAGAILVVPMQLVQTDDSSWGNDAGKFNPYRFLSKTEKTSASENMDASIAGFTLLFPKCLSIRSNLFMLCIVC